MSNLTYGHIYEEAKDLNEFLIEVLHQETSIKGIDDLKRFSTKGIAEALDFDASPNGKHKFGVEYRDIDDRTWLFIKNGRVAPIQSIHLRLIQLLLMFDCSSGIKYLLMNNWIDAEGLKEYRKMLYYACSMESFHLITNSGASFRHDEIIFLYSYICCLIKYIGQHPLMTEYYILNLRDAVDLACSGDYGFIMSSIGDALKPTGKKDKDGKEIMKSANDIWGEINAYVQSYASQIEYTKEHYGRIPKKDEFPNEDIPDMDKIVNDLNNYVLKELLLSPIIYEALYEDLDTEKDNLKDWYENKALKDIWNSLVN